MTADIINLRRARKDKARAEKERTAAENRTRFGRTKAEKTQTSREADLVRRRLDSHAQGGGPELDAAPKSAKVDDPAP